MSRSQLKIAGVLLMGSMLIAGSLFIRASKSTSLAQPDVAQVVTIADAPSRTPIEVHDKNQDGVPDWQEALLVTEALQITSTTPEYKMPETLTEQFAVDFFQNIVRSENYGAFGDTPEELVSDASTALAKQAVDELLTIKDINVSTDDSLSAQTSYSEAVATIIQTYSQENENEAKILEQALRNQDERELEKLDSIIATYTHYLEETKALSVPPMFTEEHINLLNSYQAILEDITAMRAAFTDPMYTLLRMKRYQDDASGLHASLINLYTKAITNGITWEANSPVYTIISVNDGTN